MKKILVIAAALLSAVSCSNWGDSPEPISVKIVDKLILADNTEIAITYGSNGYVSDIVYSNGKSISMKYDFSDSRNFTILVDDGTKEQVLTINNGFITKVSENNETVASFDYEYYGNMTRITNYADNSRSTLSWQGGYVYLPISQSTTWYEDEDMIEKLSFKNLSYSWNTNTAQINVYSSMNFMPLVVPEYVECSAVDPIIFAVLGALRTYYLPSAVIISVAKDDDTQIDGNSETKSFVYDNDGIGYLQAAYSVATNGERKKLFDVVYKSEASAPASL